MDNLVVGDLSRDFFVWVDLGNFLVRHQIGTVGCFYSTPATSEQASLMFLPNPDFRGFVSPFQNNLMRAYTAEYYLELSRERFFSGYPSRLRAVFLLPSEQEARAYAQSHPDHVAQRELRRVRTNGSYRYSAHDSSWVDFMRQSHMIDPESLDAVGRSYWQGVSVRDCQLQSMGQPWTQERVSEVLFEGRIDFYDRSLPDSPSAETTE